MAVEKFILQLEKEELQPKISQDEVDDIEKGVTEFVKLLADEVAKEEKLFTVKRIIKVGSFYEKTKVGNPDEFDFLLELDGTFEMERGCEMNPCSAYVKIVAPVCTNETEMRSEKAAITPDGYLLGTYTKRKWNHKIHSVLRANSIDRIQCKTGHLTHGVHMVEGQRPNVEINLHWHGEKTKIKIGIDLVMCIPCTDELLGSWKSELMPLDFSVIQRPVLVVPSLSRWKRYHCSTCSETFQQYGCEHACWKISMAPIEVDKMRNMPEPYRLSYRVLKWICKQKKSVEDTSEYEILSMEGLSSYMLKNAVLCCQDNNKTHEPTSCLEEVLQYLRTCADSGCLPAYFRPKVNLWYSTVGPPREILCLLMDYLFKTLNESSGESFSFKDVRTRFHELQEQFLKIENKAKGEWNIVLSSPEPEIIYKRN